MGVLSTIMQSYNELEEQLGYFIQNNSSIEAVEGPDTYPYGEVRVWSRLQPNQAHMQKQVLADYLSLTALCSQILVNVKSGHYPEFERSTEIVLDYIRQNTLLPEGTLQDIFNEIRREMDLQRGIMAYTYS